ncbi:MAG TPA: redoxin domain-containing protein [Terracidiphilus sp.]|nr:redoxin domain-containing protein [Terracidiphilus sp.]
MPTKVSSLRPVLRRLSILLVVLTAASLGAATPPGPLLHKPAPAFVRTDLYGRRISLRAERGKVVLLNFWATWCAPCQEELPRFAAWQARYGPQGFQVIAVSMDDSKTPVRTLVHKLRLDLPVVMGDARLGTRYGGVLGFPVTFLIDRQGIVVSRLEGATDLDALDQQIRSLLARH